MKLPWTNRLQITPSVVYKSQGFRYNFQASDLGYMLQIKLLISPLYSINPNHHITDFPSIFNRWLLLPFSELIVLNSNQGSCKGDNHSFLSSKKQLQSIAAVNWRLLFWQNPSNSDFQRKKYQKSRPKIYKALKPFWLSNEGSQSGSSFSWSKPVSAISCCSQLGNNLCLCRNCACQSDQPKLCKSTA